MMVRKVVLEKAVMMTVQDKEPVHISSVTGMLLSEHLQEIQEVPLLTGTVCLRCN